MTAVAVCSSLLDPIDCFLNNEIEALNSDARTVHPGRFDGLLIRAVMLGVPLPKPQGSGFVVCSAVRWIRHGSVQPLRIEARA
ncbi:hypothetical protein [Rhizobium leguminosarum]|uniref:Uncharacterized protein n=1 Tax=Rhizobium leguminosarum TaxID=384 RepID=A0A2K9ZGJ2_RHILE|nr:hypothetical protein [Rhizobium leguminosarum]AUW47383.1 hypothetical protein CUJ84_pRLN3000256 [Rhizobium leguminosarum]